MSNNKLKFILGIIATTGVVALSSVASAENTKQSVVSNILNRANITIGLSQTGGTVPISPASPNAGKVSPSSGNTPGKTSGAWRIKPGGKKGEIELCSTTSCKDVLGSTTVNTTGLGESGVWRLKPGGKKGEIETCGGWFCNDACNGNCGKGILPQSN
jgi:hypothetical protein